MSRLSVTLAELESRVGQELATSPWLTVSQAQIDRFAEATGDRQWIHVDPEKAKAGPFGGTIAHGFLTLSLLVPLMAEALEVTARRMAVNYGLNKVRFPAPLPSGSKVRARFSLAALEKIDGGAQVTWSATVEREGGGKPCVVAEWVVRYYV
jgi:acyl dehydratase